MNKQIANSHKVSTQILDDSQNEHILTHFQFKNPPTEKDLVVSTLGFSPMKRPITIHPKTLNATDRYTSSSFRSKETGQANQEYQPT